MKDIILLSSTEENDGFTTKAFEDKPSLLSYLDQIMHDDRGREKIHDLLITFDYLYDQSDVVKDLVCDESSSVPAYSFYCANRVFILGGLL